jgi:hypothetical protein
MSPEVSKSSLLLFLSLSQLWLAICFPPPPSLLLLLLLLLLIPWTMEPGDSILRSHELSTNPHPESNQSKSWFDTYFFKIHSNIAFPWPFQIIYPIPRPCEQTCFHSIRLLASHQTPKPRTPLHQLFTTAY